MPEIRHPRYVPPEEDFWKIYAVAEGQDKVMLLAFLHLAARRSEIFRLIWQDIDFINDRIRLGTRKRQDGTFEYDWLPMTKELHKSLRWWWENRPIKNEPHVFLCLDDTAFTKEYYGKPFAVRRHFMSRLCEKGEVTPFGFHAVRHLSASILFNDGHDLGVIQAILRHQKPSTTEKYLKSIGVERVRSALESLPSKPADVISIDQIHKQMLG
jgi:integrase